MRAVMIAMVGFDGAETAAGGKGETATVHVLGVLKKWMVVFVEGVHGMGADEIQVVMRRCGLEGVGC